jgi:hypothetical protein
VTGWVITALILIDVVAVALCGVLIVHVRDQLGEINWLTQTLERTLNPPHGDADRLRAARPGPR